MREPRNSPHPLRLRSDHLIIYTNPIPIRDPLEIGRVFETLHSNRSVCAAGSRPCFDEFSLGLDLTTGRVEALLLELVPMHENPKRDAGRVRVVLDRSPILVRRALSSLLVIVLRLCILFHTIIAFKVVGMRDVGCEKWNLGL